MDARAHVPSQTTDLELRWGGRLVDLLPATHAAAVDRRARRDGLAVVEVAREAWAPVRDDVVIDIDILRWSSIALVLMLGVTIAAHLTPAAVVIDDPPLARHTIETTRVALHTPPKAAPAATPSHRPQQARAPGAPKHAQARSTTPSVGPRPNDNERRQAARRAADDALAAMGLGRTGGEILATANVINGALAGLSGTTTASLGGDHRGVGSRPTGSGGFGHGVGIGSLGTGLTGRGDDVDIGGGRGPGLGTKRSLPVVKSGTTTIEGGLDKEEIRRVMARHLSRFRYCYERTLSGTPNLEGKLGTHFTIGSSGDVVSATALEPLHDEVDACVLRTLRTLHFPAPRGGGTVSVTYPFLFAAH